MNNSDQDLTNFEFPPPKHRALLTVTTSICSSVSTQLIFFLISTFLCIPHCHILICWKSFSGPISHSRKNSTFPNTTSFDLFFCLLAALHLPFPCHKRSFFDSTSIMHPAVQSVLLWTPRKRNVSSLHGLYPFSSPSSHHSCSLCHFTLLNQTPPHSLFIYLPATLSVPFLWSFTSLSPTDPSQWISEALLIARTSLYVQQAKESHTKHAWLNIV